MWGRVCRFALKGGKPCATCGKPMDMGDRDWSKRLYCSEKCRPKRDRSAYMADYHAVHRKQKPERNGRCALYVLGANGRVKIGISRDPDERRRKIEFTSGFDTVLLATEWYDRRAEAEMQERAMHSAFEDARLVGEWFALRDVS